MHLIPIFLVCIGLFLLFPKGFKYFVGTWLGSTVGFIVWVTETIIACSYTSIQLSSPFNAWTFVGFIVSGILGGCVVAAKG